METRFELLLEQTDSRLMNPEKRWANSRPRLIPRGQMLVLIAVSGVSVWLLSLLKAHSIRVEFYPFLLYLLLSAAIMRLLWRFFYAKVFVTVGADRLQMLFPKSGEVLTLPYTNLKTQYDSDRYGARLALEYPDGRKLWLNTSLKTRQFNRMVRTLEWALYSYRHGREQQPPMYPGPSFLRQPASLFLLIAGVALMVLLTIYLPDDYNDTRTGVLCLGYGILVFYGLALGSARSPEPPPR